MVTVSSFTLDPFGRKTPLMGVRLSDVGRSAVKAGTLGVTPLMHCTYKCRCDGACEAELRARRTLSGGALLILKPPSQPAVVLRESITPPISPVPLLISAPLLLTPEREYLQLRAAVKALLVSGWYYQGLDWRRAQRLLGSASPGAFLVRDSADRNFIFSLSVQTLRGPTSVRLHYEAGKFRLDAESRLSALMPTFPCAVQLCEHYARRDVIGRDVWVDAEGSPHSPVSLARPLLARPPSLMHSARLAVNRALPAPVAPHIQQLPLPRVLLDYIAKYPYTC